MSHRQMTFMLLALLGGLCVGCDLGPKPAGPTPQPVYFTLGVEQHGQRIPVQNHAVTLDRAPFRFVFYFDELAPMLVQASFEPAILQRAAAGEPLNSLFRPDAAIVENLLNPGGLLYVHDEGLYHNWLYFGPKTHRFDANQGVVEVPEGGYLCRRTVRTLVIDGREVPVEKSAAETIYCVFIQTDRSPGSQQRVERQRDWLTIHFR